MAYNKVSLKIKHDDCHNCNRCVRSCLVKSIHYDSCGASIIPERCIDCGACYKVCPGSIGPAENHPARIKSLMREKSVVVASLSPEWVAIYDGIKSYRMIEALKLLGFTHVSETALGAESMLESYVENIKRRRHFSISSFCPVTNSLISKYYPFFVDYLLPVSLPSVLHARMLRRIYGPDIAVVTISSCLASKRVADESDGEIDAAITFDELDKWMRDENVSFDKLPGSESYRFEPFDAHLGCDYVIPGRLINDANNDTLGLHGVESYSLSGIDRVIDLFDSHHDKLPETPMYIELYGCQGGCVHGLGRLERQNLIAGEMTLRRYADDRRSSHSHTLPMIITSTYHKPEPVSGNVSEREIAEVMDGIYAGTDNEAINCGGCGYKSCRDFAKAVVMGHAGRDMCIWLLKKEAQDKFTKLLEHIPFGVFVVDSGLKIIEANMVFAQMMGADAEMLYKSNDNLTGVDFNKITPFGKVVSDMFASGEDNIEKDVQVRERMFMLSLFRIPGGPVCGVVRNMFRSSVNSDEIVMRTKSVINDNLETVQKIAILLGESASRTEAMLNSIVESQNPRNE